MAYTPDDIGNAPGQIYDFLKRKYVSLTKPDEDGDYSSRKGSISRQQKLAEALSQMGAQEQAVSTAGGITAPVSGMGALARGLTSFGGSYLSGKAAADEAALKKAGSEELVKAISQFGKPYKIVDTAAPDVVEPGGEPLQQYTMKTPDSSEMLGEAARVMGLGVPGSEAIGAKLYSTASDAAERETAYNRLKPYIDAIPNEEARKYLNIAAQADPTKAATYFGEAGVELIKPRKASNRNPFPAVGADGKSGMFVMGDDGLPVRVPGMAPFRTGGGDGGDKAPSGYRSDGKGGLQFIPGGPADPGNKTKPPSQAFLRLEGDDLKDVQLAGSIASDLDSYAKKIDTGKMTLGLAANLGSTAGLTLGMANQNAREIGSFRATLAKLRNDTLRLNKGTQTEGDAVRAFDELFQNINDQEFVRKRLDEIKQINIRAQAQRITAINDRRELSGYDPIDESKYLTQPSAYESPAAQNTGGAGGNSYPNEAAAQAAAKASGKKSGDKIKVTINGQTGTMVVD